MKKKTNKNSNKKPVKIQLSTMYGSAVRPVDKSQIEKNYHDFEIKGMSFDLCGVCLNKDEETTCRCNCIIKPNMKNPLLISNNENSPYENYVFTFNKELGIAYAYPIKYDSNTENLMYIQDLETRRTFGIKPNLPQSHEDEKGVIRNLNTFNVSKVFCEKSMSDIYVNYNVVYTHNNTFKNYIVLKKSFKLDNMYHKDLSGRFREIQNAA